MIDWIPVVLVTFKILIFGAGMFLAIKWHYDKGRKGSGKRLSLRTGSTVAAVFVLVLVGVLHLTFSVAEMVGMDLGY